MRPSTTRPAADARSDRDVQASRKAPGRPQRMLGERGGVYVGTSPTGTPSASASVGRSGHCTQASFGVLVM